MATNTAESFTDRTGNGTAGPFDISFSYLSESEVDVTVGGELKTINTHYTFTSASQITFTSGNEPGNDVAIKFQRNTDVSSKAVDFVDGSVLTETDLDNNANQLLFSMQEIVDSGAGSNVQSVSGTTPIVSSGGTTPAISITAATTSAAGSMSASDKSKLDGIEASATADQTASEIRTLVGSASDSNVFTDADHSKLDGIETSATADQTASEIKTAYESNSDTNAFTDAEKTKLSSVESNATADQTNAEIKTAYEANSDTNAFTDAEKTKLSGVETSADVTDATNVDAAGAVMNSDLDGKGELLVGDGSGDPTALSVGTNGYILKANSSTATGLEWSAESGGSTLTTEEVQDIVGAMVSGNTETNISVTYDDTNGKLNFASTDTTYTVGDNGLTQNNFTTALYDALDTLDQTAVRFSHLDGKGELLVGRGSGNDPIALAAGTNGYVLKANSSTATGLEWSAAGSGGEANQNAFSTIAVSGQSNVAADSTTDTLNIAAGSNVTITTNASSDTVTISSTDTNTTYSVGDGGLTQNNFTDALKTKLDGIEASADVTDATNVASAGAVMDGDFTSNGFMKRTGAGTYTVDTNTYLTAVPSGYLQNVSEDSSPQLGSNLDVQTNEITTSTSNGNIKLNPNGTGVVEIRGDGTSSGTVGTLQLNCSNNNHGVKIASPPHSAGASYTLTLPNTDGNADQVLKTDGSGNLDWVDQSGGGGGGGSSLTVMDETTTLSTAATTLKFVGNGVTASGTGAEKTITITKIVDYDAQENVYGGYASGNRLTSSTLRNTLFGHESRGPTTGNYNTGIGFQVLYNATTATGNTVIGYAAGKELTEGDYNTGIGYAALGACTTGTNNTVIGYSAGESITTATHSLAIGYRALKAVTTAYGNMGIGKEAGKALTTGGQNTLVGFSAGKSLITQSGNVAVGEDAMAQTKGSDNTAIGFQSMSLAYFGDYNTALGYRTLQTVGGSSDGSGGDYNVAIGYKAGDALETGSNNIIIGYNSDASSDSVSNEITLGNSSISSLRCQVQTISSLSDARDKTNIVDSLDGLELINLLKPRKFTWAMRQASENDGKTELGFIAQELDEALGDKNDYIHAVNKNNPDKLEASYGRLIPILVKAIQELTIKVEKLKSNG